MEQKEQVGTQDRNTKSRSWCCTWNNWNEEEYSYIQENLADAQEYIIGKEVGTKGTPHLHIVVKYKNPRHWDAMRKLFKNNHIYTPAKYFAAWEYAKKDGDYFSTREEDIPSEYELYMRETYKDIIWKDWQQQIINIVESKPDKRKIHWFYEHGGNVGKSFLAAYLDWKYNAIIANGKQADVFNQYKTYLEIEKKQPKLAIIDVPRSHQEYLSYSTLEKIKDGLLYSGKYEGGKVRLVPHHLIVFANFEPQRHQLSLDRWDVNIIP